MDSTVIAPALIHVSQSVQFMEVNWDEPDTQASILCYQTLTKKLDKNRTTHKCFSMRSILAHVMVCGDMVKFTEKITVFPYFVV